MSDFLILFTGKYLIFLFLLPLVYFWLKGNKRLVFQVLLAVFLVNVVALLIGFIFPLSRPFEVAETSPRVPVFFLEHNARFRTASFPSKHVAASASIAFSILMGSSFLGSALLAVPFLVGAGRVLAYVHRWPDVIGGFGLGMLAAFVSKFILEHKSIVGFVNKVEAKLPPNSTHE